MSERKLATVRRIAEIKEIPGKDRIVSYRVDGWWVTDQKDKYKVGELVVYAEPDSWMPHTLTPFLTKPGAYPKVFNEVEGQKLKTIKMGGVYSQGLLLKLEVARDLWPNSNYDEGQEECEFFFEGSDLTGLLGIQLWEKPEELRAANAKGNFPRFLRKTDQERLQNLTRSFESWDQGRSSWQITEKLDGSSMTVYIKDGEVGVCSRNLELKDEPGVTFWEVAKSQGLVDYLKELNYPDAPVNIALQGELVGPGIQGNSYGLDKHQFFLYDIFDIDTQEYILPIEASEFCNVAGIQHVPIVDEAFIIYDATIPDLLTFADGQSVVGVKPKREGFVYKHTTDKNLSFKTVSNAWLLKNDAKE